MDTLSVLTLRLAEAIGFYMILIGVSGLVSSYRWRGMIEDLERSPGLVMAIGFPVFVTGTTLVFIHHHMHDPLATVVTLVNYVAVIEGAMLLAVPGPLLRLGRWSLGYTRLWALISLILGILLFLAGLTGRATVIA